MARRSRGLSAIAVVDLEYSTDLTMTNGQTMACWCTLWPYVEQVRSSLSFCSTKKIGFGLMVHVHEHTEEEKKIQLCLNYVEFVLSIYYLFLNLWIDANHPKKSFFFFVHSKISFCKCTFLSPSASFHYSHPNSV